MICALEIDGVLRMIFNKILFVCFVCMVLAGCSDSSIRSGKQIVATEYVTRDYLFHGIIWDTIGETVIAHKLRNIGGKTAVCGAYNAKGTPTVRQFAERALQLSHIEVNGTTLIADLEFFQYSRPRGDKGVASQCALTDIVWRPEFEKIQSEVVIADQTIRVFSPRQPGPCRQPFGCI